MRLTGKAAICQFLGRGWATLENWILNQGFPAKKIQGVWESDAEMVTAWRQEQLLKVQQLSRRSRGNPNFKRKGKKSAQIS